MSERVLKSTRTIYRSYTPNGSLWTESYNQDEVLRESRHTDEDLTFTKTVVETYQETTGEFEFTPNAADFPSHDDCGYCLDVDEDEGKVIPELREAEFYKTRAAPVSVRPTYSINVNGYWNLDDSDNS